MKKIIAILLCTAIIFSLVGCSTSSTNKTTSGTEPSTTTTPSEDAVSVAIAKENDAISMNSMYATDGMSFEMIHATVDGLMDVDADGKIINALAESYTISEDGLVYTFKLRDAQWSNGTPVTANDFVFAWRTCLTSPDAEYNYLFTAGNASVLNADAILAGEMEATELGIKAIDEKTLEVTLSAKTPYFLSLMAFTVFYPVNEEFYNAQNGEYALLPDKMLACGPYKLVNWERDTKLEFVKNDTYYDVDKVKIDNLTVNITAEASTSATAFEAGEVSFTKISSDLIDKYKDDPAFTQVLEGYLWYLQPNLNNEIMNNKNLRYALAYAVDKVDLVENVLKDGSVVGNGFVPTTLAAGPDGKDFRATAGDTHSLDKAKAVEYFEKAKEELDMEEITIKLLYETADPAKTAAEYLQANLQQNLPGLIVEMDAQSKEARLELQKTREFDVVLTRWGPDYADPTTYLNMMITGNSYNYGDYVSEAYDAKMAEAASATDDSVRWTALLDAEKILMEDLPVIAVFQVGGASLIKDGITGIEAHSVGVPFIYKNLAVAE